MTDDPAAAHRYAQAFVTLANQPGQLEACLNDLAAIHELFQHQPLLTRFLTNPEVAVDEKRAVLTRLLQAHVSPLALRLLGLLLWKGRLALLPSILTEARRLRDQVQGIVRGVVLSARPLSEALVTRLRTRLGRHLDKRVELTTATDADLIGGVAVRLGNAVFDGSVRRGLERLREHLATINVASATRGLPHGAAP